jgi:hypothetical protein
MVLLALIGGLLYPILITSLANPRVSDTDPLGSNGSTFLTGRVSSVESATAVTFATIPQSSADDVTEFLSCFDQKESEQGLNVARNETSTSSTELFRSIVPRANNLAATLMGRTTTPATNSSSEVTHLEIIVAQNLTSVKQAWGLSRVLAAVDAGLFATMTDDCSASFNVFQEIRGVKTTSTSVATSSAKAFGGIFLTAAIMLFLRGALQDSLREAESGFKSQQIISGASLASYWCSMQAIYIFQFLPVVLLFIITCFFIPLPEFKFIISGSNWYKNAAILILSTNALLPSAFLWSVDRGQVFATAATWYTLALYCVYMLGILVFFVAALFLPDHVAVVAFIVTLVTPLFGLTMALMPMAQADLFQPCGFGLVASAFIWIGLLIRKEKSAQTRQETPMLARPLTQVITVTVPGREAGLPVEPGKVVEVKWLGKRIRVAVPSGLKVGDSFPATLPPNSLVDEDVKAEEERVLQLGTGATDKIIVQRLAKQYPSKETPALAGISFGVPEGQCFGLLGPSTLLPRFLAAAVHCRCSVFVFHDPCFVSTRASCRRCRKDHNCQNYHW